LSVLVVATCLHAAAKDDANSTGEIAYLSGVEPENYRVCVVDVSTLVVRDMGPGTRDGTPVWSPDGAWLSYATAAPDGTSIIIVRADGSESRAIPHAHQWNRWPRWSPTGRKLAYCADDEMALERKLMVYDLESNTESQLVPAVKAGFMRPVWVPNERLLYGLRPEQSLEFDGGELDLSNLQWKEDGFLMAIGLRGSVGKMNTDVYVITPEFAFPLPGWVLPSKSGQYSEWAVEVSPNGEQVAFESNDGGDREIFVLSKKGTADISNHRAADWNPVWAPDSKWLAFESFRDGRRGVYRAYSSTSRVFPVAVMPHADNWAPAWSSNGKWLAIVSNRTGDSEIFITKLSGEKVTQITKSPGEDLSPAWRPVPKVKKK
jgi:Tol biopolymer transport system component